MEGSLSTVLPAWLALLGAPAVALPYGAHPIAVPEHEVRPMIRSLDARGPCAALHTDLGYFALTTDDGTSYRAIPVPSRLDPMDRVRCAGDQFFILSRSGLILRLVGDRWQPVSPRPGTAPAGFDGIVITPGKLYVGAGSRLLASADGGVTFVHATALAGVRALASDGKDVVLAGRGAEVFAVGQKVGQDDTLSPLSKLGKPVLALGFVDGEVYASTEDQLLRSSDRGRTWKLVPGAPAGVREILGFGKTPILHTSSGAYTRDTKGKWSRFAYRAYPGQSSVWQLSRAGPLARVANPGDSAPELSFARDPAPTVRALAAHKQTLVVALFRPQAVHVSTDAGRSWQLACKDARLDGAVLDADRLQLGTMHQFNLPSIKDCRVPGLKTRLVSGLPAETCNGDLCVRFGPQSLLRSRDRGKTWEDLSPNLARNGQAGALPIVAAAAAGREILIARGVDWSTELSSTRSYDQIERSTDDGRSFTRLTLPLTVTSFAPGDGAWFLGTVVYGVVRLPYAPVPGTARPPFATPAGARAR
jgi:hypothetical protein